MSDESDGAAVIAYVLGFMAILVSAVAISLIVLVTKL